MNSKLISTVQDTYQDLISHLVPDELKNWVYTSRGADLWVDGTDALLAIRQHYLPELTSDFSALCKTNSLELEFNKKNLYKILEIFDILSAKCCQERGNDFWELLGFGILLVYSCGGIPKITEGQLCIVNDTVLCLLSKSYRKLRFNSYNYGISFIGLDTHKSTYFRPEFGVFLLAPPVLIDDISPPRVQFYSISHELVHYFTFGDAYLRCFFNDEITNSLFLNAEETSCAFDLLLGKELVSHNHSLNLIDEFSNIETGAQRLAKQELLLSTGKNQEFMRIAEAKLKAKAQAYARSNSFIVKYIEELSTSNFQHLWIGDKALKLHASYYMNIKLNSNPIFNSFVSLIPPNSRCISNLIRSPSTSILDLEEAEFCGYTCQNLRVIFSFLSFLKLLIARAGEFAILADSKGLLSKSLLNDLARWAWGASEILSKSFQDSYFEDLENIYQYKETCLAQLAFVLEKHSFNDYQVKSIVQNISNPRVDFFSEAKVLINDVCIQK
ncbi:MAG: hypothetical protein F6K21_28230 [Symploca sp. SIO2D2]|nr:hypothetical protein [Symploca sp. SIO2D2]